MPLYPANHIVTATEYAQGQDAWIDYSGSFTLTASVTNPTKGNSTYTAMYSYLTPKTVAVAIRLQIGSTFAVGSGTYFFSLPISAADSSGDGAAGVFFFNDSGVNWKIGAAVMDGSGVARLVAVLNTGVALIGSGSGFSNGDDIRISYIYRV